MIGYPRLVRLDPNVPTKTRGNAALGAEFGHGIGSFRLIGRIGTEPVRSFPRGTALSTAEAETLECSAWDAVGRTTRWEGEHTEPAMVASSRPLPSRIYDSAVTRWTDRIGVEAALAKANAIGRWARSPQGLVGASAAVAWPAQRTTYELIAYREPSRVGAVRVVDSASVLRTQARYPELFLCHDPRTRRILIAPHSPCPVLFGLRATRPERLPRAKAEIVAEPVERWVIFETNQATGDHLRDRTLAELRPFDSARVTVTVTRPPEVIPGGHVRLRVAQLGGPEADALVFEPTKLLPAVAASLGPGDRVALWVGVGAEVVLRVEGIEILECRPRVARPVPPRCNACGKRGRSLGTGRGFRCPRCHRRWPPEAALARPVRPSASPGIYHPTPSSRRHLAPLGPEPGVRPTS